jgi:hypothetical protein
MDKQFAKIIDKFSFTHHDGFFQINGDQVLPIGAEKVNRFFDGDLNKAYTDRITAAVDPFNTLAIWLYPSKNNPNTTGFVIDY